MGAQLFHTNGRTDRHDEANHHFSQFANAPNNLVLSYWSLHSLSYRRFHSGKDISSSSCLKRYLSLGVKWRGREADHTFRADAGNNH